MTERREGWWKWLCSCTSGRSHLHCLNDSKWFPSQIRSDNIVHPEFSAFYVDFSCRGGGIGGVGWCGLYKTEETIIDSSKGFNACLSLSFYGRCSLIAPYVFTDWGLPWSMVCLQLPRPKLRRSSSSFSFSLPKPPASSSPAPLSSLHKSPLGPPC